MVSLNLLKYLEDFYAVCFQLLILFSEKLNLHYTSNYKTCIQFYREKIYIFLTKPVFPDFSSACFAPLGIRFTLPV